MQLYNRIKAIIAVRLKQLRAYKANHPQNIPHFNGKKWGDGAVLKEIGWYSFGVLLMLTALEMAKYLICNRYADKVDTYFCVAEKYLSGRWWINAMITVTLLIVSICWIRHVTEDRYLSLKRVAVAIGFSVILPFAGSFAEIHSAICVDYVTLIWVVVFILIGLDLIKIWNKRWGIQPHVKTRLKYCTELPHEELDKRVRLDYAKKVAEWLLNTDISKSAFAVGITSEWGSGKTSFLLDMERELEEKCYMLDFKPWHCQTPDQIVNEFFELFRKEIKRIYSPLQKPILRYAQLLSDASLPSYLTPLFYFLPGMGHSIEEYNGKIEKGLKQLDRPVVVTIDDMDRLAADEMFEVLRLIRNTAAFPNLIFIVCYDKAYVVKQIQNKGIDESDLYMEKIFPLELSLPKTEDEMLIDTFRKALIEMWYLKGKQDSLISMLSSEDELMMVRLLPTYRKMKRFARTLMTNTMFVMEKLGKKNIDLYDVFLIELVHFCMEDVYMVLRDRPEEMLEVRMDEAKKQARYYLKENAMASEGVLSLFRRNFSQYEEMLLRKCFDNRSGDRIHYLPYVDSYQNYFCMATPYAMISSKEFKDVLDNRSNVRLNVHNWFWKLQPKKSASLYSRMMSERIKELTLDEWKGHAMVLFSWLCETDDKQIKDVMEFYFKLDNLRTDEEDADVAMKLYAKAKLEKMIGGKNVNRMNVARALCGYYQIIEEKQDDYLLDCDEVKELLKLNFDRFMEEKQSTQDAINVIAMNGNDLNAFVKANAYTKESFTPLESRMYITVNLIIDSVISYFSAYEEKSSHLKEASEMYKDNNLSRYKTIRGMSGQDLESEKFRIFGNEETFQKFLTECFVERRSAGRREN